MGTNPFEKFYKLEKAINFQLYFIVIVGILLGIVIIVGKQGENLMLEELIKNILLGVITGGVTSTLFSIIIYFRFLRKIPEATEKKINDLLNSRLSYETSNHNAVMGAISPTNEYLSNEHKDIATKIQHGQEQITTKLHQEINDNVVSLGGSIRTLHDFVKQEQMDKKLKYSNLQMSQREIVDSVEKISNLNEQMQSLNTENVELKETLFQIKERLNNLQSEHQQQIADYRELLSAYHSLENKYSKTQQAYTTYQKHNPPREKNQGYDYER